MTRSDTEKLPRADPLPPSLIDKMEGKLAQFGQGVTILKSDLRQLVDLARKGQA